MSKTPACGCCGRTLDRVDHVGTEHFILDGDAFREVGVNDGGVNGEQYGLASEVDLKCGYCGVVLDIDSRGFFYRRWGKLKRFMTDNRLVSSNE